MKTCATSVQVTLLLDEASIALHHLEMANREVCAAAALGIRCGGDALWAGRLGELDSLGGGGG